MKQTTKTLFTATLLAFATITTQAQESAVLRTDATDTGTRGGGESVDVRGRPVLRDLVDNTVCDWASGPDIIATQQPRVNQILASLRQAHWYFALLLRREMESLNFCRTESLVRINTADADGLTIYVEDTRQVAIRVNGSVYLNTRIYNRMDATSRAYLLVHEALHGFIPMDSLMRNSQLRSTVATLGRLERGEIAPDQFFYQLSMNQVRVPHAISLNDTDRDALEAVLNRAGNQLQRNVDAARLSLEQNNALAYLNPWDRGIVDNEVSLFFSTFSRMSQDELRPWLPRLGATNLTALLRAAINNGASETVSSLLDSGLIDANQPLPFSDGTKPPLHYALTLNSREVALTLLARRDVSVNTRDSSGRTPLHIVVGTRGIPIDLLDVLLSRSDLDVNARTPLQTGRNTARLLTAEEWAGPDEGLNALMLSVRSSDGMAIAQRLLRDRRFDLNARDANGNTLLHHVVIQHPSFASALIEAIFNTGRVDANLVNNRGLAPLLLAVNPYLAAVNPYEEIHYSRYLASNEMPLVQALAGPVALRHGLNPYASVTPRRRTPRDSSFAERHAGQNAITLGFRTVNDVGIREDISCWPRQGYSYHASWLLPVPQITTLLETLPRSTKLRLLAMTDTNGRDAPTRARWIPATCARLFGLNEEHLLGSGDGEIGWYHILALLGTPVPSTP